jgi:hypothetical protein
MESVCSTVARARSFLPTFHAPARSFILGPCSRE